MLLHDGQHGTPLIDALARHGDGLPANVLPLAVNEVTQVGLEAIVAAFAYGATGVRFLLRAKPLHDIAGLSQTIAMADAILAGLGFAGRRVATIETDDPDALGDDAVRHRSRPHAVGATGNLPHRRQAARAAALCPDRTASRRACAGRRIALPEGAPLGAIRSMSAAARCACPACRPARPARCSTIPTARR